MDLSGASPGELARELRRRSTPDEALDAAYELPPWLDNDGLRGLYEVLLARMHRESEHLPVNTITRLLIERIAFNYVVLKYREGRPLADTQGFADTRMVKDFNTFWLAMTDTYLKQLATFRPADRDAIRAMVQRAVVDTMKEGVTSGVIKTTQVQQLMPRFASALDTAGL